ncbi:DUF7673 family protein [Xylella fastidiosa]|uniref:DUF7673 family protein n=1 Tax=Xylella fastidiosa TaxID=2371 RepID=UPI000FEC7378|nr:hypothetical protein [Xylella fastidiosa]MRU28337.1 hypothetical protein [Xylella fastidiosa subsp. multiplex]MRU30727.1 hypothetical protein [Xylella fastidiosa subsp. multiplex]UIT53400.1 hypothetical protein LZ753_11530 [Xylella fastidiosa subsp. fastidiosa]WLE28541.1 hypothetical protein DVS74_011790 [Xylella fastidiosa subsp. multiplex]
MNKKSHMTDAQQAALERLIRIAKNGTHQSRHVADFLLAWWNTDSCGGFNLTQLWGLDTAITVDMTAVFTLVAGVSIYPDSLGYEEDFKAILRQWRPALASAPC